MYDFAERLGAPTPTPGGGAAAARVGLYASALIRMVTGITLQKIAEGKIKGPPPAPEQIEAIRKVEAEAVATGRQLSTLELEDQAAFQSYLDALRLPRGTEEEKRRRDEARRGAAWLATAAPLSTMRAALDLLALAASLHELARTTPLKAESDLGASVHLAHAAFNVADLNVQANLAELSPERKDQATREQATLKSRETLLFESLNRPH